jgi:hypothetical protein
LCRVSTLPAAVRAELVSGFNSAVRCRGGINAARRRCGEVFIGVEKPLRNGRRMASALRKHEGMKLKHLYDLIYKAL